MFLPMPLSLHLLCRVLPEIGKSSGILATLGVFVEHFGITLHTEGLTKGRQLGETIGLERSDTEIHPDCTAGQNSAILFGGRL